MGVPAAAAAALGGVEAPAAVESLGGWVFFMAQAGGEVSFGVGAAALGCCCAVVVDEDCQVGVISTNALLFIAFVAALEAFHYGF